MDIINLNSFLKFGYFLDYKYPEYKVDFSGIDKKRYENTSENDLIKHGINLWYNTIEAQFNSNEKHVVPLSGGIDSRAILATLLEFTDAKNIYTYTFGTHKTYDYEIGNYIAKTLGTKHTKLPLNDYNYNTEELIKISQRIDHQTLLFLHPPTAVVDDLFADHNVWSGTIIDVFFGRHFHKNKGFNFTSAAINSFSENIFVKSMNLTNVEDIEFLKFIDFDESVEGMLDYEHIIDLLNRQLKFIAPHVLMRGYKYKTLLNKQLTDFALSIDNKYIENQYLYKKIFLQKFPFLFSLPTKTNHGLPLKANKFNIITNQVKKISEKILSKDYINPYINYIDFGEGIINRKDLRTIVYENIMDLKQRNLLDWIDIEMIWNNHMNKKANYADALITLASLEIHFKSGLY